MISRAILPTLNRFLTTFPVVLVGGSRQVGKTTLVRETLSGTHRYVLLEDPEQRLLAQTDPRRFLERHAPPVIFDEFQTVPELLSYLQGYIDKHRMRKGQIVLTGSQNFLMMEAVTQSLAGRVGILDLFGLSSMELPKRVLEANDPALGELLLRGTYPELWADPKILASDWYGSYVQTYLERDVRRMINVGDLGTFERFIRVCAARTGQAVNFAEIANDSGTSPSTTQRWTSVLQATHLIKLISPYHVNMSSRIKKSPKLYFMDTGLAAYLMGFRDVHSLLNSPQYGPLFETLVVSDLYKRRSSEGEHPMFHYLQTKSKIGADLMIETKGHLEIIEIKGARTIHPSMAKGLVETSKAFKAKVRSCILAGPFDEEPAFNLEDVKIQVRKWFRI
jgi:predicted AAA+ superfamily ATPase